MTTLTIAALEATQPAHYLAAVGLTYLAQARIRFDDQTPVLDASGHLEQVVSTVATGLEALVSPETFPLPDVPQFRTTTPTWSALAGLSRQSWEDDVVDATLRTFDLGGVGADAKKPPTDPKVSSASWVLISGRSYVRKSLAELWPAPTRAKHIPAARQRQRAEREADLLRLLRGEPPQHLRGPMGMRFTVADPSPRLRTGTEEAVLFPIVEALAYAGATRLLPRQLGAPTTNATRTQARPGLTWALNPVSLSAPALIAIHEQAAAPAHWARYTATTRTIGGGTNASHFVDIRPLEAP